MIFRFYRPPSVANCWANYSQQQRPDESHSLHSQHFLGGWGDMCLRRSRYLVFARGGALLLCWGTRPLVIAQWKPNAANMLRIRWKPKTISAARISPSTQQTKRVMSSKATTAAAKRFIVWDWWATAIAWLTALRIYTINSVRYLSPFFTIHFGGPFRIYALNIRRNFDVCTSKGENFWWNKAWRCWKESLAHVL